MTGVVGYYVHHVGSGHRHRAEVLAARLAHDGVSVTGLSSLPRPPSWAGEWVRLPPDDGGRPLPRARLVHPARKAGSRSGRTDGGGRVRVGLGSRASGGVRA